MWPPCPSYDASTNACELPLTPVFPARGRPRRPPQSAARRCPRVASLRISAEQLQAVAGEMDDRMQPTPGQPVAALRELLDVLEAPAVLRQHAVH
eukprot:6205774-Pyramimonas_sp.AAC.2